MINWFKRFYKKPENNMSKPLEHVVLSIQRIPFKRIEVEDKYPTCKFSVSIVEENSIKVEFKPTIEFIERLKTLGFNGIDDDEIVMDFFKSIGFGLNESPDDSLFKEKSNVELTDRNTRIVK